MKIFINLTIVLVTSVLHLKCEDLAKVTKCRSENIEGKRLSLSVLSQRNDTGKWQTTFSAQRDSDSISIPNNITVDVAHSITDCEGRTRIRITGVIAEEINDPTPKPESDGLQFYPKCGTNVAVVNNGRSVQKINWEIPLDSVVFTNRPLKDGELFEVRLDKKNTKWKLSLGIGATTHSPRDIPIANHINHLPHPSWAQYHGHLYHNGSLNINNYAKSLDELVVGDRAGVMRSAAGNLHFFVNGVDQGPAASNIPTTIYGVLELYHNAAMATIVN